MLLTACGSTKTELLVETKLVKPTIPAQLLVCPDQPPVPEVKTQKDVAGFLLDVAEAGADCREKLARVRDLVK